MLAVKGAMSSRLAVPVGARALFVFHLTLLSWWTFVQLYYRIVLRFVKSDPSFWMGVVSLGLIAAALIVTARFARGRRNTASETAARVAVALAVVDLIGETLQFVPRLGLPALLPSDKSTSELLLRGAWFTCEYAMRCAMFVALWRAQANVDKRLVGLFFGLIGMNYLTTWIAFVRSMGPFTEFGNALPLGSLLAKINLPMSLLWLGILVYLSRRVARGLHPATS